MIIFFYVRGGHAYLPTTGRVSSGAYADLEPCEVVPIVSRDAVAAAIERAVDRGNPKARTIPKPPIVLKHAGLKSWSAFERGTTYWELSEQEGTYRVVPWRRADGGGWEADKSRAEVFTGASSKSDAIRRLAELVSGK